MLFFFVPSIMDRDIPVSRSAPFISVPHFAQFTAHPSVSAKYSAICPRVLGVHTAVTSMVSP